MFLFLLGSFNYSESKRNPQSRLNSEEKSTFHALHKKIIVFMSQRQEDIFPCWGWAKSKRRPLWEHISENISAPARMNWEHFQILSNLYEIKWRQITSNWITFKTQFNTKEKERNRLNETSMKKTFLWSSKKYF